MFTEIDYLVQVERRKDDIAYAERYRRGEAHLPVKVWGVNTVRRLVQQFTRASSDAKPARTATGVPLGNMGA
ncbi:MAG: hypothetical protein KDD83_09085 [Caldilineaceae bacterium]|nr:hypothetical protein [Caldilineaceae bacterium]